MDSYHFARDLDVIGSLEGTDKSSFVRWDYLRHYQELFSPWRDQPINFLEIGIGAGPSLRVWRAYFSSATIIGVDNRPECARFADDRVVVEIGSQEDPAFLHRVCAKYPPTIAIDDGSHMAHHIVYTLEHVFPALAPGGVYIIEDLSLHFGRFGPQHHNTKDVSAVDYFLRLARSRMDFETACDAWGDENYILKHVDSVSFFAGGVALRKKGPRDTAAALHSAEQYMSQITPSADHLGRFAQFLVRHDGSLERAEQAARDAAAMGPGDFRPLMTLGDILTRQGKLEDAAAAARTAAALGVDDAGLWYRLSQAERRIGQFPQAIEALRKATSLRPEWFYFRDLSEVLEADGDLREALAAGQQGAERGAGQPGVETLQHRLESLRVRVAAAA
jgi:Flp pilus assembly protein TadD